MLEDNRNQMWEMSKQVLRDSALENGALVAANGLFLPPTATPYHFVWGRDASKQLLAAHALQFDEAPKIRENFLRWIVRCVPGGDTERLLVKRNHINGPNDFLYNDDRGFQPDNNGALITAIDATRSANASIDDHVIQLLANGLASKWSLSSKTFIMRQQDLWENTTIEAGDNNFFTHALFASAYGLTRAAISQKRKVAPYVTEQWQLVAAQMYEHLFSEQATYEGYYYKKLYPVHDEQRQLDSALTLVIHESIPISVPPRVIQAATNTIHKIGNELLWLPYGARRYVGDIYDGIERYDGSQSIAGAWPLLGYSWVRAARQVGFIDLADKVQDQIDAKLSELYSNNIIPKFRVPEQLHPDGDSRNGLGPMHFAWGSSEWVMTEKDRRDRLISNAK
ncbi:MAG TPA: glycoside hydrolase family 15 protein [Candidatus Limnocylindrales bacterium]|nr:glycoside hydrolase family 15 protein [Candidatus Limnocylindrales bacterium]